MGFSRQEYWSGLLFPSPGHLPNPGIELRSPALQSDSLPSEPWGKPEQLLSTNYMLGIKKQRYHFAGEDPYSQSYGFSRGHIWVWDLDHKEGWELKNWCFQIVVLEQTLESPLDYKESKPVHPKENKSWIFIGRNDAEVESPIVWPPDAQSGFTGKDPEAGKHWGRRRRGWQRMRWLDDITNSVDMSIANSGR